MKVSRYSWLVFLVFIFNFYSSTSFAKEDGITGVMPSKPPKAKPAYLTNPPKANPAYKQFASKDCKPAVQLNPAADCKINEYKTLGDTVLKHCQEAKDSCETQEVKGAIAAHQAASQAQQDLPEMSMREGAGAAEKTHSLAGLLSQDVVVKCLTAAVACEDGIKQHKEQLPKAIESISSETKSQCTPQANAISEEVVASGQACIAKATNIAQLNQMGAMSNFRVSQVAGDVGEFLKDNWQAIAVGGGVIGGGALLYTMMSDDDDKSSHSVAAGPDGGQCLNYGKDQKRCYTNEELAKLCASRNVTYQDAQNAAMTDSLCQAFDADTRAGAGGDPNTCHTHKPEYWKQAACITRFKAQCAASDVGDCPGFNTYYCYDDNAPGKGGNYCGYLEAKTYCAKAGTSQSSPACAWLRVVQGNGCTTNLEKAGCYPGEYPTQADYQHVCKQLDVETTDPVCSKLNNNKFYFAWRNPGTSDEQQVVESDTSSTVSDTQTSQCSDPSNMNDPVCVIEFCSVVTNQSSPVCASVVAQSTAETSGSYTPLRYPAGELPSDVSSDRSQSLFGSGSNSMANRLCSSSQLYDCGALEGYVP